MKKAKRFLTGLLSAALALSLCAMPAMAATDVDTTTPQDVWTQDTGSITIHKYEYNGQVKPDSTGEETDVDNLPEGATALKGATFSIYQVMDRAELQNYYDGTNGKEKVTVDTYLNEAGMRLNPVRPIPLRSLQKRLAQTALPVLPSSRLVCM